MQDTGPNAAKVRQVGDQQATIEGDILFMRFSGDYKPEEAQQLLSLGDAIYREQGRVFLLADLTKLQTLGPKTRKVLANWPYLGPYQGVGFGVSLPLRAVAQLVLAAQRAIGVGPPLSVQTFATETEARAWIDQERQKMRATQNMKRSG